MCLAISLMAQPADELSRQVRETEIWFEKALAQRDITALQHYLAPAALFLSADGRGWRGAGQIGDAWRQFSAPEAGFSRETESVYVIPSGTLALVIGPVRDAAGKQVRIFNSVWRRETNGGWRLVLDYACPACDCAATQPKPEGAAGEVWRSEAAFAKTMADRDHAAFMTHVAEDAVFISRLAASRGREQVGQAWRSYYEGPQAPFSWGPDRVLVLDSGDLALSQGPVWNPGGNRTETFSSVWRKEPDGRWRVVLDRGCDSCRCP